MKKTLMKSTAALVALGLCTLPVHAAETFRSVGVTDSQSFGRPVTAFTFDLPADWQMQGGVQANPSHPCATEQRKTSWRAADPQGAESMTLTPSEGWVWGSIYEQMPHLAQGGANGCNVARITDLQSYLQGYIARTRQSAQITAMRPRPDVQQKTARDAAKWFPAGGPQPRYEAVEATIRYREGGREVEEVMVVSGAFMRQQAPDQYGGMSGHIMIGITSGVVSLRDTDGSVDRSILDRALMSGQSNPEYDQLLMQEQAAKMRAQNAAFQQQQRQRQYAGGGSTASSGQDVSDIMMDGWRRRNGMQDAGQARTVDGIREVNPYANQYGERVEIPTSHQYGYEMNDGSYVGTNDPSYNPYADGGGQQMQDWDYGGY